MAASLTMDGLYLEPRLYVCPGSETPVNFGTPAFLSGKAISFAGTWRGFRVTQRSDGKVTVRSYQSATWDAAESGTSAGIAFRIS